MGKAEGLPNDCVVNLDNLHVIAKRLVGERAGVLSSSRERLLRRALGFALDWPELKSL